MPKGKTRIQFNKIKNKKDSLKKKLKKDKNVNKVKKNKRKIWYYILSIITFLAIVFILLGLVFATYIVIEAPDFSESLLFDKDSTVIYDKDGKEIATLGMNVGGDNVQKRVKLTYDDFPQVLVDALVATEDSRFFQHNGVDLARFLKASIGQVLGNSGAGGASTLTMQVSKNALTDTVSTGFKGIVRKFTDIYLAVFKIEKNYTKEDIIELYLNSQFLGNHAYGVEQASQTYFGKSASNLSISEAALIAGLFQAPSAYDPFVNPDKAEARRNQVLNLMLRHGYINEEECEIAKSLKVENMIIGDSSTQDAYQGYIDTVIQEVIDEYEVNPYVVPLDIYTYFDNSKQDVINNIYNGNYGYEFKDDLVQLGIAVVDNSNGSLIAVGAGRNRKGELSYNYATMINRHPGSTIKPILDYGPAIEYLNWSTYTPLFDEAVSYTKGGTVNNFNFKYEGLVTMKYALGESKNTCALETFRATTNDQKWKFATSLGITPGNSNGIIYESSSIGAFEGVNPVQMASAYSAIASGGYYTKAYTVNKIIYKDSKDEVSHSHSRERVMKTTTAYMLTNVLFNVTPYVALVPGTQVATKTGTSSYDESIKRNMGITGDLIQDSWVATYNPDYTISFWYGYDELYKDHYNTMSATSVQRRTIQGFLTKNIMNGGTAKFTTPSGITSAEVELETFPAKKPSAYTPENLKQTHLFVSGTEPTEVSTRFSQLDDPTNLKIVENGNSATVSWTKIETPKAINDEYLKEFFIKNYAEWWTKYYELRQEYNSANIGYIAYDIYVKKGDNVTYYASTADNKYTIKNANLYDAIIVKSAYSGFKNNASNGASINVTGQTTTFEIELLGIKVEDEYIINPTFKFNSDIPDLGLSTIKFLVNKVDLTNSLSTSDVSYVIKDCTGICKVVSSIDTTKKGEYEIHYTVNYLGTPYSKIRFLHIEE